MGELPQDAGARALPVQSCPILTVSAALSFNKGLRQDARLRYGRAPCPTSSAKGGMMSIGDGAGSTVVMSQTLWQDLQQHEY